MSRHEPSAESPPDAADELREHFGRLGVELGDWSALYPVPLLLAAWGDGRLTRDEASRVRAAAAEAARLFGGDGPAPGGRGGLPVDLMLDGQQRPRERDQLRLANELLCWHLAKDFPPGERNRRLEAFDALCHETFRRGDVADEAVWRMRARIDAFLAARRFREEADVTNLPEPDVRLAWLPEIDSWHPLVVTPLAELVNAAPPRGREDLRSEVDRALASRAADPDSALGALPAGGAWGRNVFQNLTTVPPEAAAARIEEARGLLARGLAAVEFPRREKLLKELEGLATEATRPGLFGRSNGGENVVLVFGHLRAEVDRVRTEFAGAPASAAPDGPAAVAPSDLSITSSEARGSRPVDTPASAGTDPPDHPPEATSPAALPSRLDRFAPPEREPEPPSAPPPIVTSVVASSAVRWDECLRLAGEVTPGQIERWLARPLLFERHRREGEGVVVVPTDSDVPANFWLVGDLHCDLLAMAAAWDFIRRESDPAGGPPHVLFLGDFVDRGTYGLETLLYLFRLIGENEGRIGVLPGNHDEFTWDDAAGRFASPVQPAETVDQFNAALGSGEPAARRRVAVGKAAAGFFARRPRAVFLPDGLLLAHGGFPHEDLLAGLADRADLNDQRCLKDFVWLRFSTARRRRVNRASSGCEFGRQNFADFCQVATKRLSIPVARMVRGHDHVPDRYRASEDWGYPVLTINAMCRPLEGEYGVDRRPTPAVARHVPGELPRVYRLELPADEVDRAYGRGLEGGAGEGTGSR